MLGTPASAAPSLKVSLDRDTISLGESATVSFTFADASQAPQPALPAMSNLQISYAGQSSQFTSVNGQVSSSVTHNFVITPTAAGDFVIPAIRVNVGGTILASQPLKLKVVQGQPPATAVEKLPAFLKLIVPKNQIYVGEPIPIEIQLYCQDARDVNMPQLPSEGFTVGQMPQPAQTRTKVGGEVYNLVIFKMAVAATKAGSLPLGPASLNLKLLMGPRDIFGQYTQARQVSLKSEPQTIQVLPLPTTNRPPNFNGSIGNFSMTFNAGPTNVAVGDPITLKVKISGRGSLDLLSLPAQNDWREFKTYPATSKVESADPLGLEGAKAFEQIVVPQNSEIKELPPFSFSFFDPNQKQYRTLTNAAIPLVVRPTAATPQPTVFSSNADAKEERPSREIVHIKPQLGTIHAVSAPLLQQPWFLILQSAAPLIWMALVISRKRKEALQNNPRLRRQKAVAQIIARGLSDLSQYAAAKETDKFFATVFRLLQEQLGERLDLPASGITEAVIDERLRPMRADPAALDLVHELFQACNQARYASQRTSEELASYIPKLEQALAELRKLK
ncbi:MAG: BatD family protein [Verrucomicrobiota bacterium]